MQETCSYGEGVHSEGLTGRRCCGLAIGRYLHSHWGKGVGAGEKLDSTETDCSRQQRLRRKCGHLQLPIKMGKMSKIAFSQLSVKGLSPPWLSLN